MSRSRLSILAVVLVVAATPGAAQQKTSATDRKPPTPEAFLELRGVRDPEFSPDGTQVAFVVSDPLRGPQRNTHIWMYDARTNRARQFTYSEKSESTPRWSPDGKQLAFLSNRGGEEEQIYVMRTSGGEAEVLTKGKRSIGRFAWSPTGKEIAFLAPDAKSEVEEKKEKEKDDAHVVDKEDKRARLWISDLEKREERALTPATWKVAELAWLPDGESIVMSATDHPESDRHTNRLFAVNLKTGKTQQLLAPRGPFGDIKISPDGKLLSFVGCREDGPEPHDLWLLPLGASAPRNLTGASLDRQVMDYRWLRDGSILLDAVEGFHTRFVQYTADGVREDASAIATNPGQFSVSNDGRVAFVGQTAVEPPELWMWKKGEAPAQVSHTNAVFAEIALLKPELYKYKSFDGLEIEAALLKPAGYDGKSKLPTVALIHGGPTGAWLDEIEAWGQLLAANGFLVMYPNVRGSIGYGEKFIEKNRADWGGGDFRDVMEGVHELVKRGMADPNRLGIGGWSYGGYMAEWAVTQTDEFKAAVSGAGMANLISEFGTEDSPAYDEWFWSAPYEKPEGFLNSSPFLYVKNARTPTLILQGEADRVDPLGQSQELYRGLKWYGIPAELVVYPREPHGFREEKHRVDMQRRMLEWFKRYLK